jgi:hypothetical protein
VSQFEFSGSSRIFGAGLIWVYGELACIGGPGLLPFIANGRDTCTAGMSTTVEMLLSLIEAAFEMPRDLRRA